jgi:hypothetical protein
MLCPAAARQPLPASLPREFANGKGWKQVQEAPRDEKFGNSNNPKDNHSRKQK